MPAAERAAPGERVLELYLYLHHLAVDKPSHTRSPHSDIQLTHATMGSNSNMIPATDEDKALFKAGIRSNYCPDMIRHIEPYAYDPIPAVNAKGGRNVDGWKSVFRATVQKGASSASMRA